MLLPRPSRSDMRASGRSTTVAAQVRDRTSHIGSRCGPGRCDRNSQISSCACQKTSWPGAMPLRPTGAAASHYPSVAATIEQDDHRECNALARHKAGGTMSHDKAFLAYLGVSLAVVGFALLVFWAGHTWLD